MRTRHLTIHGTGRRGDAVDVLIEQNEILKSLFEDWADMATVPDDGPEKVVPQNWSRGTIGKLIIEHAAVDLAAREDILRGLESTGQMDLAKELAGQIGRMRQVLDRLDEEGRGMSPIAVAASPAFGKVVDEFQELLASDIGSFSSPFSSGRLAKALGANRKDLHGAKFLRKHAPTHPGAKGWSDRFPLLVRIHTAYDRIRGFPWAESSPAGNPKISEHYNRDLQH
jgi:hypothetical protein